LLVPDVGVENVIHDAGLDAVQPQPDPAVTFTVPEPDAAVTDALAGVMLYPQPAACVIVTGCPATVSTPERDCVVGLATNEYETGPVPVPFAPDVIDIHETALEAVQAQPAAEVTVTEPVPAVLGAGAVVGATE
jgi:hypothetical protein